MFYKNSFLYSCPSPISLKKSQIHAQKSLGVGGEKEEPKLNTILNLKTDISIATESRADINKINNLKHKYRTLLSGADVYTHNSIL